ncbi:MAG: hypothetical protein ACK5U4_22620, partial [Rhodospirillales bacterium]
MFDKFAFKMGPFGLLRARLCDGRNRLSLFARLLALALVCAMPFAAQAQQRISFIRDAEIENTIRIYAAPVFRAAGLNPDDIAVHIGGRTHRSGGHGFSGVGRKRLLQILQQRCTALGVTLRFETPVPDALEERVRRDHYDFVIAADGVNGKLRDRYAATFRPETDLR